ncbi:hypothetical protein [Pectinatus frisingensis]|uniref:hypothetical protein n=1 Tax=Pectinatus frisingensis TaxID=865 RepID=UPI0018C6CD81|nr:hypothetical protein [Pectinatus frisingensis]
MSGEAIITAITLICTIFYVLIIKPLRGTIDELKDLIKDVRKDLKDESDKRQNIEVRLSLCEEKIDVLSINKENYLYEKNMGKN